MTKLRLQRIARREGYTIGRLYVDGTYFCDTLEDRDRGLTSSMTADAVRAAKVKGATAIPTGTYGVTLAVRSPRFGSRAAYRFCGGRLPRLQGVPGFDGILIHIGNTAADTEGCILVGRNTVKGRVTDSTATFRRLYARLLELPTEGGGITIDIV